MTTKTDTSVSTFSPAPNLDLQHASRRRKQLLRFELRLGNT
jgi:hypothetical protein